MTTEGDWILCLSVAIDCGPLDDPINGAVQHDTTILGSIANYSCLEGYRPLSGTIRICTEDGAWSGVEPTCESKS